MSIKRIVASAALGACLTFAVVAGPATAHAAAPPTAASRATAAPTAAPLPTLPQVSSAQQGAVWLADRLTASGFIPSPTNPAQPDLGTTANVVLALASAGVDPSGAHHALAYLAAHVNAYVKVAGNDGPGQLALLILDAHALRTSPTSFGGTDLVTRLLATERKSGPDKGLFGAQDATYDGAYRQGLALAALAGAGVTSPAQVGLAESWLLGQQCPDGGWTSLVSTTNPCSGNPADFEGPDTNSTALAIQGLSAQGVLGSAAAAEASTFIAKAEDSDGGWGYEPNAKGAPGSTDPDSTALVIQSILALGQSPSATAFVKTGANPVSALLSFQLKTGSGKGAYFYPGSRTPNVLATYQAVPAAASVKIPFDLAISPPSLPTGTVGTAYSVTLTSTGGTGHDRWGWVAGSAIPPGLVLHPLTGVLSGRPTEVGTFRLTIEMTDGRTTTKPATDDVAWKVFTLTVRS
jgi:hypothetical protein